MWKRNTDTFLLYYVHNNMIKYVKNMNKWYDDSVSTVQYKGYSRSL